MNQTTQLNLYVTAESESDIEKLADLTRQMKVELMELGVEDVDFVSNSEVPTKAKSGAVVDWGTLLVTLAASGGVLTTIINVLQSWLARHNKYSLSLEIDGDKLEITGISSGEQQRLINVWLSRHQGIVIAND